MTNKKSKMPTKVGSRTRIAYTSAGGSARPVEAYTLTVKGPNWFKFTNRKGHDIVVNKDGVSTSFWVRGVEFLAPRVRK